MVDANYAAKAQAEMKKGDKCLKGSFFGNIMSSKSERAEKALECYKTASVNFKLAKNWEEASGALLRMADCDMMTGGGEQGDYLVEAANLIKKVNSAEAIGLFEKAVEIYCNQNRIGYAAKLYKQIGETYEQDFEYVLASKFYEKAADLFYADNDRSSDYNNMKLKVADLSILEPGPDFVKSIKIYEEVAEKYLENKLTEPSAKNLYFKAALLFLANDDTVGCNLAIEKYCDKSPSFFKTRQHLFVVAISKALEENQIQNFADECFKFNEIIPFDKWATNVLTKIKEKLKASQPQQAKVGGEGGLENYLM